MKTQLHNSKGWMRFARVVYAPDLWTLWSRVQSPEAPSFSSRVRASSCNHFCIGRALHRRLRSEFLRYARYSFTVVVLLHGGISLFTRVMPNCKVRGSKCEKCLCSSASDGLVWYKDFTK